VRAPRTLFLRYPHGAPFGEPGNAAQHATILRDLLLLARRATAPGEIVEPGYRWRRTRFVEPPLSSFAESG